MSHFGKLSKSAENMSSDDRLVESEGNFKILIEKIKTYDAVLEQFKIVSGRLDQSESFLLDLKSQMRKMEDGLKSTHATVGVSIGQSNLDMQDFKSKVEDSHDDLRDCNRNLGDLFCALEANVSKISEKLDKLSDLKLGCQDFESYKKYSESTCATLREDLRSIFKKLDDNSRHLNSLEMSCNKNQKDIHQFSDNALLLNSCIQSNTNKFEEKIYAIQTLIKDGDSKGEKSLQDAMIVLKQELLGTPSSLESVKNELIKRFEASSLDASNSVLKANNCVKQLELMDRKIENLSLLLKKHELSK